MSRQLPNPKIRTSHYRSPGEERREKMKLSLDDLVLENQSDKHWNCLKGSVGETSERRAGAHIMGFSERFDTILN